MAKETMAMAEPRKRAAVNTGILSVLERRERCVFLKEFVYGLSPEETARSLDLTSGEVSASERKIAVKLSEAQL